MLAVSSEEVKRGKKRPALASDRQSIADDVSKILLNLQNNDSPCELTAVHLFVKKPQELGRKDSLVLVATKSIPVVESDDFKLFSRLCYDDCEGGASSFSCRHETLNSSRAQSQRCLLWWLTVSLLVW